MSALHIMCVDDQRSVLSALQKDLAIFANDFEITVCESAHEAMEVINELDADGEAVAVLICDHIMPNRNGIDFMIDLSHDERFHHIKTILLTGLATHQDTIVAINKARIDHYLEKPWNRDELVATVKTLLTEYIFDTGLDYNNYKPYLDQNVFLKRMHNSH